MRADKMNLPNEICGAKFTDKHKEELLAGRPVMVSQKGDEFSALLQISAVKRGIEFLPKEAGLNQQQSNRQFQWMDENGNINAPKTIGGVSFSAQSCEKWGQQPEAIAVLQRVKATGQLTVKSVERKVTSQEPPLLYELTTLQKEANSKLNFSADKTLSIAQSLYEKKVMYKRGDGYLIFTMILWFRRI